MYETPPHQHEYGRAPTNDPITMGAPGRTSNELMLGPAPSGFPGPLPPQNPSAHMGFGLPPQPPLPPPPPPRRQPRSLADTPANELRTEFFSDDSGDENLLRPPPPSSSAQSVDAAGSSAKGKGPSKPKPRPRQRKQASDIPGDNTSAPPPAPSKRKASGGGGVTQAPQPASSKRKAGNDDITPPPPKRKSRAGAKQPVPRARALPAVKSKQSNGRTPGASNYSTTESVRLAGIVAKVCPSGQHRWEKVAQHYNQFAVRHGYPQRLASSLRKRFFRVRLSM